MSDPFDLPERVLPDHVRQAALLRVLEGIDRTPPRRRVGLAPLLIAASVIALMAGATVVTSTLASDKDKTLNAAPTSPHPTTTSPARENGFLGQTSWGPDAEMQRCWAAGHQPTSWTPLVRQTRTGVTTLLYREGSDIAFCQLTKEQVTFKELPYPDPPSGKVPAKLLFTTPEGGYAGVIAPGVDNLAIDMGGNQGDIGILGNGAFVVPNSYRPADTIWFRNDSTGYPGYRVPKADIPQPTPATTKVNDPTADRTSPAGQRLKNCIPDANPPLADPDYWAPGAYYQVDASHWVQLARWNGMLFSCATDGGTQRRGVSQFEDDHKIHLTPFTQVPSTAVGTLFAGLVADPKATTLVLSRPGDNTVTATVDNGTVIASWPAPAGGTTQPIIATVKDAAGTVIDVFRAF